MNRILLVEDDPDIAELIRVNLENEGYTLDHVSDGRHALEAVAVAIPDFIILDLMLPGLDGIEVCKKIREENRLTPIIMLTARSDELDRVLGLELGADDYITKPFSIRELMARIKAIRRRIEADMAAGERSDEPDSATFGPLTVHFGKRRAMLEGTPVNLTAREYELLATFVRNPGKAFTRSELLETVWGYRFEGYDHTVNTHINRLRNKIERDPSSPRFIQTVWGIGYRFAEAEEVTG